MELHAGTSGLSSSRTGSQARVATARPFHALIVTIRPSSAPTSSGDQWAATASYSSRGTWVSATRVTTSAKRRAARSRSVKKGDSFQIATALMRWVDSPTVAASVACISTQ